jgi:hypothetical protein
MNLEATRDTTEAVKAAAHATRNHFAAHVMKLLEKRKRGLEAEVSCARTQLAPPKRASGRGAGETGGAKAQASDPPPTQVHAPPPLPPPATNTIDTATRPLPTRPLATAGCRWLSPAWRGAGARPRLARTGPPDGRGRRDADDGVGAEAREPERGGKACGGERRGREHLEERAESTPTMPAGEEAPAPGPAPGRSEMESERMFLDFATTRTTTAPPRHEPPAPRRERSTRPTALVPRALVPRALVPLHSSHVHSSHCTRPTCTRTRPTCTCPTALVPRALVLVPRALVPLHSSHVHSSHVHSYSSHVHSYSSHCTRPTALVASRLAP